MSKALNRYTSVQREGVSINNLMSVSLTGRTAESVEVTELNSPGREYLVGLPNPGELSGSLYWNPNDPVHKQLEADRKSGEPATYTVAFRGKVVNARYTDDGADVASDVSATVTVGTSDGTFVASEADKAKIEVGHFLIPSSGEDLVVTSVEGGTIKVTQPDGSVPTAVSVAQAYDVKQPAVKMSITGRVSDFSLDGGEQNTPQQVSFTITLSGEATWSYGTPNIT